MTIDIKHETKNFVISLVAVILTVFVFEVALTTGVLYQLAKITDDIRIQFGLIPEHILPKLIGGYSYSIILVNKAVFIILNLIFGFTAFKLINKRGTKCPSWFYGLFMTTIFFLVSSKLVLLSGDSFNWLAVLFGIPTTFFIQSFLATFLLTQNRDNKS